MTQAPSLNLVHGDDDQHDEGQDRGRAVDAQSAAPVVLPVGPVVLGHPGPGHGEAGEHADGVEGDELVDLGPGDHSRMIDTTVSTMMPVEKTRRWPRLVSWRGR